MGRTYNSTRKFYQSCTIKAPVIEAILGLKYAVIGNVQVCLQNKITEVVLREFLSIGELRQKSQVKKMVDEREHKVDE